MRIYLILLFEASALFTVGCGSAAVPANQPPAAPNSAVVPSQPAAEAPAANPAVGPADTLRALNAASKAGDVAGIKRRLSQGSLAILEEGAKEQQRPVDELLKENGQAPFFELPELGKETIDGDSATVEVKNPETGSFEQFPLVKENGEWKVAIDVYLDQFDLGLEDDEKKP